jgi:protein-disulfide isomerase
MVKMSMNIFRFGILVMLLAMLSACNSPSSNPDETITRQQADEILKQLRDMRALLEKIDKKAQSPARQDRRPTTATLDLTEPGPILGEVNAPVTVVEFTDYQCPYCKRFAQNTFPFLKRDYIDTGKVRWMVRDLPLGFHNNARKAAQAAYCADEQDKFWAMRDSLFRNSSNLGEDQLKAYAADLELDTRAFNDCLASERYLADIDNYSSIAAGLRLTGTPSFIIGKTVPGTLSGKVIIGAQAPAVFRAEIQKLLP